METLVNLSWRLYLALPLMALGATLALRSARLGQPALLCTVRGDPSQLIPLMQRFRAMVIGLAMIGIGAAWIWHLTWLLIESLAHRGRREYGNGPGHLRPAAWRTTSGRHPSGEGIDRL